MFDLLAHTNDLIRQRGGWLRLVGPGSSHVGTVEETALAASAADEMAAVAVDG